MMFRAGQPLDAVLALTFDQVKAVFMRYVEWLERNAAHARPA